MRIHYHHSKWFKDYLKKTNSDKVNDRFFKVADDSYLPSKRSLRILDAVIQLAQKYNLILCLDIFSLVQQEMGNPRGWLEFKNRITSPRKIEKQKEFVKLLANRYKDIPGISWDLWNEPRLEGKFLNQLKKWSREIISTFRRYEDNHTITIGGDVSLEMLDILSYGCIHTDNPRKYKDFKKQYVHPIVFQEVWNPAGCSLKAEKVQAQKLGKDLKIILENGFQGFIPWQWTKQSRLWNHMYNSEEWDDKLGVVTHCDGIMRPAGRKYKNMIRNMRKKEER